MRHNIGNSYLEVVEERKNREKKKEIKLNRAQPRNFLLDVLFTEHDEEEKASHEIYYSSEFPYHL